MSENLIIELISLHFQKTANNSQERTKLRFVLIN